MLQEFVAAANQTPGVTGVFSNYLVNVPQVFADIDREKAKRENVPLANVFEALQVYLGSLYVQRPEPVRPQLPGDRAGRCAASARARNRCWTSRPATSRARWCRWVR